MDSETSISLMRWKYWTSDAVFAYFGNFSLRMHSFDHIATSGLKSYVIFESSHPFSYKGTIISGAPHHFQRLL